MYFAVHFIRLLSLYTPHVNQIRKQIEVIAFHSTPFSVVQLIIAQSCPPQNSAVFSFYFRQGLFVKWKNTIHAKMKIVQLSVVWGWNHGYLVIRDMTEPHQHCCDIKPIKYHTDKPCLCDRVCPCYSVLHVASYSNRSVSGAEHHHLPDNVDLFLCFYCD